jgi:hypothetical protein
MAADEQNPNDIVLHEDAIKQVVDDRLQQKSNVGALADVPAAVAAPTQAEFNALQASHNSVLQVLRDAGLIPAV